MFNVGDPIVSFGFFAAASEALKNFSAPRQKFYMRRRWFICLAVIFAGVNILIEANNVSRGFPLRKEFSPPQLVHFLLMPIYAAAVVGVLPHLFMDVKGKTGSKFLAVLALFVYACALIIDLVRGKTLT